MKRSVEWNGQVQRHGAGEAGMFNFQIAGRRAQRLAALFITCACAMAAILAGKPAAGGAGSGETFAYAQFRHHASRQAVASEGIADPQVDMPEPLRVKQERALRKYRFDQMKKHGEELAKLANSLQKDLEKSNENILSLQIVDKAQKIEKLAKKIQEEAKTGT
jgi:hypothetical protein